MSTTIEISPTIIDQITDLSSDWIVIAFNNEVNTFQEVITVLLYATKCSPERALELTNKIHNEGEAIVYSSSEEACNQVAKIISQIGIVTQVRKD